MKSRIPLPGLVYGYDIVRLLDVKVGGRIKKSCEELVIYENLRGRSDNLRKLSENRDLKEPYGETSSNLRKFKIEGRDVLNKLAKEDYVKVHWGIKPNFFTPSTAPNWGSPSLCFDTPDGMVTLRWDKDNLEYVNGTTKLSYISDSAGDRWVFSYYDAIQDVIDEEVFDVSFNQSPLCFEYPTGFSFVKKTGPSIYYQIVTFDHNFDDMNAYSHTTIEGELRDIDNSISQ